MLDLGTAGGSWSYGTAINSASQVIGLSATETNDVHATLWSRP
jgi:probable HAF family extracellular repeat protein